MGFYHHFKAKIIMPPIKTKEKDYFSLFIEPLITRLHKNKINNFKRKGLFLIYFSTKNMSYKTIILNSPNVIIFI